MQTQQQLNFERISQAIYYLQQHFKEQPGLETVAREVHLSPFHFQKLFTEWAGTSPKKFVQYLSIEYAKNLLRRHQATLFETAAETGLSGTGRLHDLFISIEGMTPAEYKNGGKALHIQYSFADSPFGSILIASTTRGICHLAFYTEPEQALEILRQRFPAARFLQKTDTLQQNALFIFRKDQHRLQEIKLHVKGTGFQLKVWETLLKIPFGGCTTYGQIAERLDQPGAARAVGTAVGDNPVAYLIPCHRVIRASGLPGGYMWGLPRKAAILGWEAAQTFPL